MMWIGLAAQRFIHRFGVLAPDGAFTRTKLSFLSRVSHWHSQVRCNLGWADLDHLIPVTLSKASIQAFAGKQSYCFYEIGFLNPK
jgi:hypothetical protein